MSESTPPSRPFGLPPRGITQSDVSHAADSLLRLGERPTNDKVRAKIGKGSLTTLGPLLDSWWKTLSARLDSGPAALHRLPEPVAHIAEALWVQALEETRRRISIEQRDSARIAELDQQRLDLRSHVLSLREGELDSRLRDRDRTIGDLNLRLREVTGLLRKEQATRETQFQRIAALEAQLLSAHRAFPSTKRARASAISNRRKLRDRAATARRLKTIKRPRSKRTGKK